MRSVLRFLGGRPSPPAPRRSSPTGPGPSLVVETARVVWPEASRIEITRATRPASGQQDHVVLPGIRSPRWLLPAGAPTTAAAVVGQEPTAARQAAARVLEVAHRRGLTHRLPLWRLRVDGGDGASLVTALVGMVGEEVEVAIRLGSWAEARSLVVRLFGPEAGTVAFGKVGIDAHGRAAVRAESANLSYVAGLGLKRVIHSDVLCHEQWQGLEVLLVSPLVASERRTAGGGMPVEAMHELAHSDHPRVDSLANSRWLDTVRRRLDEVTDPRLRSPLEAALRRLTWAPQVVLPLGPWHGDWTAWNMAWDASGVLLWDWEHFATDVPMGFDLVHYLAQQLRVSAGTGPAEEETWLAQAADVLARHVGLAEDQRRLLVAAYLLEVNLRFVLDRQGTSERDRQRAGWGLDLLGHAVDQLPDRG